MFFLYLTLSLTNLHWVCINMLLLDEMSTIFRQRSIQFQNRQAVTDSCGYVPRLKHPDEGTTTRVNSCWGTFYEHVLTHSSFNTLGVYIYTGCPISVVFSGYVFHQ